MRRIAAAVLFLAFSIAPAVAQFPGGTVAASEITVKQPAQAGGPAAIGQAMLQPNPSTDPNAPRVALVQAPAQESGGLIQFKAFGWLEPYVDSLVQALIVVGLGWFGKTKYGQMLDDSSRASLETFLKNRASSLIADGAVKIQGKQVNVHSTLLAAAANEGAIYIPDAMKRFGLTPDAIAQKIVDHIPQTPVGAQMVVDAHKSDPETPPAVFTEMPDIKAGAVTVDGPLTLAGKLSPASPFTPPTTSA